MFSAKLLRLQNCIDKKSIPQIVAINSVRHGHRLRGKPPGVAKTITQRLEELNVVDEEIAKKINIGFPQLRISRTEETKKQLAYLKEIRGNADLEKKARNHELEVNLMDVRKEWVTSTGQYQIKNIAEYYGVYEHLFGCAYFLPRVPLNINYKLSDEEFAPVCYGNVLKPSQAKTAPQVTFDSRTNLLGKEEGNTLWTLVLTNPDGHFKENDKEYVHWFVGNIPNDDVAKGDVVVPYLQPFPPKGTGFHRHIFVLYKQNKKIDFSGYQVTESNDLNQRTFSTLDFYRKYQDQITPGGLAFFQSEWEKGLTDFYHNVLNIKEPIYEYDFPGPYLRDDSYFPLRQPFNLYLDKHRDQKEVAKEFLVRKLKATHPFDGPEPPLQYPNAHAIKGVPSWLKTEIKKARLGWGRINEFK